MEKQSELPKDLSFEFDSSKLPSVSIFKVLFTFMTKQDIFFVFSGGNWFYRSWYTWSIK